MSETLKKELELQLGLMPVSAQHSVWNPLLMIQEQESGSLSAESCKILQYFIIMKECDENIFDLVSVLKIILWHCWCTIEGCKEPTQISFD